MWKELIQHMSEHLTSAHLYLDLAKSGYLFHGYSGGMQSDLDKMTTKLYAFFCEM